MWSEMQQLEKVTIRLSKEDLRQLDLCIRANIFTSRSEAIRASIHAYLDERMEKILAKLDQMQKIREVEAKLELIEKNEKEILRP